MFITLFFASLEELRNAGVSIFDDPVILNIKCEPNSENRVTKDNTSWNSKGMNIIVCFNHLSFNFIYFWIGSFLTWICSQFLQYKHVKNLTIAFSKTHLHYTNQIFTPFHFLDFYWHLHQCRTKWNC